VTCRRQPAAEALELTAVLRTTADSRPQREPGFRAADSAVGAPAASAEYPFLVSVRGSQPVPARKEGRYFWLRHQVCLGIVWGPSDVTVLETYAP
jgi:hypothetical protein